MEHATTRDQDDESNAETVEKIERTDHGYRLKIESTRGTGTRNEDTVKAEARTETLAQLQAEKDILRKTVVETLEKNREHQPDDE